MSDTLERLREALRTAITEAEDEWHRWGNPDSPPAWIPKARAALATQDTDAESRESRHESLHCDGKPSRSTQSTGKDES